MRCSEAGHFVLIDDYQISSQGDFKVKINWGWGNACNSNGLWYSGSGAIIDPCHNWTWNEFRVFSNTTPINW